MKSNSNSPFKIFLMAKSFLSHYVRIKKEKISETLIFASTLNMNISAMYLVCVCIFLRNMMDSNIKITLKLENVTHVFVDYVIVTKCWFATFIFFRNNGNNFIVCASTK